MPTIVPNDIFWNLLDQTHAIITGLVAMEYSFSLPHTSTDLHIIVPLGQTHVWRDLLLLYGFEDSKTYTIDWDYMKTTTSIRKFINPVKKRFVILFESHDATALPPIFSAPSTATMTFITSTALYCLYPTLTVSNRALVKWDTSTNPSRILQRRGVQVATAMDEWNCLCTPETCAKRRWDEKRTNIGRLTWRGKDKEDVWETHIMHSSYEWNRGLWCERKDGLCIYSYV